MRTLIARRQKLLARYLTRLSPLASIHVDDEHARLCGLDVARHAHILSPTAAPSARFFCGPALEQTGALPVEVAPDGTLCVPLSHTLPDPAPQERLDDRYVVIEILNGQAQGPLRTHLYDLGPRGGFRLVGVERPASTNAALPTL